MDAVHTHAWLQPVSHLYTPLSRALRTLMDACSHTHTYACTLGAGKGRALPSGVSSAKVALADQSMETLAEDEHGCVHGGEGRVKHMYPGSLHWGT